MKRDRYYSEKELRSIAADLTSGEQDIICVAQAATYEELLRLVVSRIRSIEGIRDTVTNLVLG